MKEPVFFSLLADRFMDFVAFRRSGGPTTTVEPKRFPIPTVSHVIRALAVHTSPDRFSINT